MAPASRLGRPRRASLRSASFMVHSPALTPSQRRGSGSQRGERARPRAAGSAACPPR